MRPHPTRILLIEDEESDYLLPRRTLASIENRAFDPTWADSWQSGIEAIIILSGAAAVPLNINLDLPSYLPPISGTAYL